MSAESVPPSQQEWFARGTLKGGVSFAPHLYPVQGLIEDPAGQINFTIAAPAMTDTGFGFQTLLHDVDLHIRCSADQVDHLGTEALAQIADALSLTAARPIESRVGTVQGASFDDADPGAMRTRYHMRRVLFSGSIENVGADQIVLLWGKLTGVADNRRIIRAMRWLRHSYAADDAIETFSALAIALESLSTLLPKPSAEWLQEFRSGLSNPPEGEAKKSEIVRHFAATNGGIVGSQWTQLWRMRDELFHGGMTEDLSARERIGAAIPDLRRLVFKGITTTLDIPVGSFPVAERPQFVLTHVTLTGPAGIRFADQTQSPNL